MLPHDGEYQRPLGCGRFRRETQFRSCIAVNTEMLVRGVNDVFASSQRESAVLPSFLTVRVDEALQGHFELLHFGFEALPSPSGKISHEDMQCWRHLVIYIDD